MTVFPVEQRARAPLPDAAVLEEILRFHNSCLRAEAEASAASAQSFFDFDDLPPAGVAEEAAACPRPGQEAKETVPEKFADPVPVASANAEGQPEAQSITALQRQSFSISRELGRKLAMTEQDTGLPDSAGDPGNPSLLHGPVDDKCALALLRGRADPNAALGTLHRTPLFAAAERCNFKLVDSLLKFRADANRADLAGETPLFALCHAAAWADASLRDRRATALRLLEGEADINFANPRGRTALHTAIASGDVAILPILLEESADVNARDLGGFTALMWAAGRGNAEVVKSLLTARANTALAANRGQTAMLFALTNKCESVVETLQKHAAMDNTKAAGSRQVEQAEASSKRCGDIGATEPPAAFMGQVRAKFAPDLSSNSYAEKVRGVPALSIGAI
ncbi:Ripk4 [Symbiodinium natans]|uniref:Ripk4 protein n=1 Tax=Symbiodinium natans TaxID=878477 RepID=A0A812U949_9DINO|nr:Ripk4 [Symbiodinium natans]